MKESNKGFTLIELLAVITIMAILMIVGIPAIIKTIETSRKGVFEKSVGGIERSAKLESKTNAVDGEELLYKYSDGSWEGLDLEIDGEIPKYIEIKVKEENKVRYAISDGRYCAVKEYDGEMTIKKIGDKNTSSMVEEKYCELDAVIGTTEDCFETSENSDGTLTIKAYYNYEGNDSSNPACPRNVIIPNKIEGKKVTKIGEQVFYNKGISNVVIPNTIKKIGNAAFRNCQLTSLILPEGVEFLGREAFADNQISSLSLPSSLTTLSNHAFRNNRLPQESAYFYKINGNGSIDYSTIIGYGGESKAIELPSVKNGVTLTTIADNAFYANGLTSVVVPGTVTKIGSASFRKNNIKQLVLPEGLKILGGEAFADNQISSLSLPSSLTTLSNHAFRHNKLPQESAYIYKRNSDGSIDYTTIIGYGGASKAIEIPSEKNGVILTKIAESAFYTNYLTSVKIPDTVVTIGNHAFRKCNLTELVIPKSVSNVGGAAFYDNPLTSVTIKNTSDDVTIGDNAFGSFDTNNIVWQPEA